MVEKDPLSCSEFLVNENLFLRVSLMDSKFSWIRRILSSFLSCLLLHHSLTSLVIF